MAGRQNQHIPAVNHLKKELDFGSADLPGLLRGCNNVRNIEEGLSDLVHSDAVIDNSCYLQRNRGCVDSCTCFARDLIWRIHDQKSQYQQRLDEYRC